MPRLGKSITFNMHWIKFSSAIFGLSSMTKDIATYMAALGAVHLIHQQCMYVLVYKYDSIAVAATVLTTLLPFLTN